VQFGVDAFCGNVNRLGSAVGVIAQGQLQADIDQAVASGKTGFVVKLLGLDSLTGADDPMIQVGAMRALPMGGAGYDGANDLDWWYATNLASIDASRNPIDKLPGSIAGNVFNAGPGYMSVPVNFFPGSPVLLRMSSVKLQLTVGASSAPTASAGGVPPGHVAAEHLDPALTSFATLGQAMLNTSGKLCGDVVASSLAVSPAPPEILPGGAFPCAQGYSAANSFLDVLVNGCTVMGFGVLAPTQPDKADPGAPVEGAGAPYTLSVNAQKVVTGCADKNNAPVILAACLNAAAFSSYFRVAMDRVILK
jgi:hypothetical protein